ncbi:MAG: hypothetical protein ABIR04_04370 [Cypionkella sp.]
MTGLLGFGPIEFLADPSNALIAVAVVSCLRLARERQIACVKIAEDHFRIIAAEDALKDRFGLQRVQVVPDGGLGRIDPRGLRVVGAVSAQFYRT